MSAVKSTGFDMAQHVVPGTVIERVYFAVPIHGTIGDEFATLAEAIEHGIAKTEALLAQHLAAQGPVMAARYPHPQRITVDVRWNMVVPTIPHQTFGGSQDRVAKRITYDTIAEAQEHLAYIAKYAGV